MRLMVIKGVFFPQKAAFLSRLSIVWGIIRKKKDTPTDTPTNTPTVKNKRKVQGKAAATLHQITAFMAAI